jgi:hypothetical protein
MHVALTDAGLFGKKRRKKNAHSSDWRIEEDRILDHLKVAGA